MGNINTQQRQNKIMNINDLAFIESINCEEFENPIFIKKKYILLKNYVNPTLYIHSFNIKTKKKELIYIGSNDDVLYISDNENYIGLTSDKNLIIYETDKLLKNKKNILCKIDVIQKNSINLLFEDFFVINKDNKLNFIEYKNKKSFLFNDVFNFKCNNNFIAFYKDNKINIVDVKNKKENSYQIKKNINYLCISNNGCFCYVNDDNECYLNNTKIMKTNIDENLFLFLYILEDENINVLTYYNNLCIVFWINDKKIIKSEIKIENQEKCFSRNGIDFYFCNKNNIFLYTLKYLIPVKILETKIALIKKNLNEMYKLLNYSNNDYIKIISAEETIMEYELTPQMKFFIRNDCDEFFVNVTCNVSIYNECKSFILFQELISGIITEEDILDDIYKIENKVLQYDTFNNLITHFYDFVIVLILKENDIINELTLNKTKYIGYIILSLIIKYCKTNFNIELINEFKIKYPSFSSFIDKIL